MTWREWRNLFRFEKIVDVPHLSVYCMCPYGFVRILWYFCPKDFKAWPSQYETGIVLGWRWPWREKFKERKWVRIQEMPLAVYWAMDEAYLARVAVEFAVDPKSPPEAFTPGVGKLVTIRKIVQAEPRCPHNYWIASCENCARKALLLAMQGHGTTTPKILPEVRR